MIHFDTDKPIWGFSVLSGKNGLPIMWELVKRSKKGGFEK